jgi:2-C-methyl-D-erythritol 4-phosphate cytidylyltransferase
VNAVGLVLVAGRETLPSVYGESLLRRAIRGLLQSETVQHIVVMVSVGAHEKSWTELASVGDRVSVVAVDPGEPVDVGRFLVEALPAVPESDVVVIQDPARAFTPASLVDDVVHAVRRGAAAAVPVLPVTDTIKQVDSDGNIRATVDRSSLRLVQGPQAYAVDVFRAACERGGDVTTWLDRLDKQVTALPGHPHARKIRTAFDLAVARAIIAAEQATGADR